MLQDEAGLMMMMHKAELEVRTSGRRVHDETLTRYLEAIACEVDPELCEGIRIYVISRPAFNASMASNGMMMVWTGSLLRAENEAQLASVIGHELVHYRNRHQIERLRVLSDTAAAATVFSLVTLGAGVGLVGDLATIAAFGGVLGFNRDQEREADFEGLERMANAGYDPREASKVWENLIAEREAAGEDDPALFFATHPLPPERAERLAELGEELVRPENDGVVHQERFERVVGPWRHRLLEEELVLREPEGLTVVLDRLVERPGTASMVAFFRGELERLNGGQERLEEAIAHYEEAVTYDDATPEAHRSLGLALRRLGRTAEAQAPLRRYLELAPEAGDRRMIEAYLADEADGVVEREGAGEEESEE